MYLYLESDCYFCRDHPIRMSQEEFQRTSYLPLPILDEKREHYLSFDKVYGGSPSEKDQPSRGTPEQQRS